MVKGEVKWKITMEGKKWKNKVGKGKGRGERKAEGGSEFV